ncbi:IclR family transcriptional regulator [Mesorhizobium sp. B2-4-9]|uniref:IclR family transcriptional regulator n=1 Tax=Mesorhizobium sp. B2-4-9 TaxID=2589940 RepID=UPI00112CFB31|nr:IclR family transcriptional regulator [Mesorhizobium sp. B2-4-9]TPL21081.1 IclR family transcriptional regulator [Mesorhizobium sp. B2-4-9]
MSVEGRGVRSVEIGARLLQAMGDSARPMMLRDIARDAGLAPAVAHPYLVSFRKLDLVEKDETSGLYRLGSMALQLGLARLRGSDIVRMANMAGAELADETALSMATIVWGSYGPTVIYLHEGADQMHVNTRPGTVYSLTGTASGLVFAAHLPESLVKRTINAQRRERTNAQFVGDLPDLKDRRQEIADIRALGYSVTDSHPVPGVSAIAAPVFDLSGQLQLVVTLIGFVNLIDTRPGSDHVRKVQELSRTLSRQVGYDPAWFEDKRTAAT